MSLEYLKKLYEIYCEIREEEEKERPKKMEVKNSPLKKEFGEVLMTSNGYLFLLVKVKDCVIKGCVEECAVVYKISEWIDFATQEDFIFEFMDLKWRAIRKIKVCIPTKYFISVGIAEIK